MKRLLLVTEASAAGVLSAIENICHELSEGYQIYVLLASRPDTPALHELRRRLGATVNISVTAGSGIVKLFAFYRACVKIINSFEPDVVHFHSSVAGFVGRLAMRRCHRVVSFFYSPHCFAFVRKDIGPFKTNVYKILERAVASKKCPIIAVSGEEAALAQSVGNKRAYILYNTVSLPLAVPEDVPSVTGAHIPIVGTVGRMTVQKDPEFFVETARKVLKSPRTSQFLWVGGGDLKDKISTLVKNLYCSENITIIDTLSRSEVLARVREFDIYFHCAAWEANPLAILEAMYLSRPIVVRRFEGVEELIQDGHEGFVYSTMEEAVEKIKRLLDDPVLRRSIGENARKKFLSKFSPGMFTEQLLRIYEGRG